MIHSHQTTVQRTSHYYTVGTPGPHIKHFYLVCHGYGQLAGKFIYKFDGLDDGQTLILAPEALSRFYWKRQPDIVGASWMTKENRLDEITDYTRHIKNLYDQYIELLPNLEKITLIGFSQGCATQVRWLLRELPHFDHLVLWAGLLPEDLDYLPFQNYFKNKKIWWVYGNEDEFLKKKYIDWHRKFARSQKIELEEIIFEGKHIVDRNVLADLVEKLR